MNKELTEEEKRIFTECVITGKKPKKEHTDKWQEFLKGIMKGI